MTKNVKKDEYDPVLEQQGQAIKKIATAEGFVLNTIEHLIPIGIKTDSVYQVLRGRRQRNTKIVQREIVKLLAKRKLENEGVENPSAEAVAAMTRQLSSLVFQDHDEAAILGFVDGRQHLQSGAIISGRDTTDAAQETGTISHGAEHIFELDDYDTTKVWLKRSDNGSIDMNVEAHDPSEGYAFKGLIVRLKSEYHLALAEVEDETIEGQFCKINRRAGKGTEKLSTTVMLTALGSKLPPHSIFGDLGYEVMGHKEVSAPFSIKIVAEALSRQIVSPSAEPDLKVEAMDRIKWLLDNHARRADLGVHWDLEDETKVPVYIGRFHWSPDEQ
ncbi:MAG: hypothetical protein ABJI96_09020 [Paracoccaceae bacterium]|uniref:hypothetical protein n=1 Tax=Roseibium sp. TaxID=1936156 RepID=UPI0032988513